MLIILIHPLIVYFIINQKLFKSLSHSRIKSKPLKGALGQPVAPPIDSINIHGAIA